MINPVSSQSNIHLQPSSAQPAKSQPAAASQQSHQPEDSVQISAQAKAALAAQDADHDGDGH